MKMARMLNFSDVGCCVLTHKSHQLSTWHKTKCMDTSGTSIFVIPIVVLLLLLESKLFIRAGGLHRLLNENCIDDIEDLAGRCKRGLVPNFLRHPALHRSQLLADQNAKSKIKLVIMSFNDEIT